MIATGITSGHMMDEDAWVPESEDEKKSSIEDSNSEDSDGEDSDSGDSEAEDNVAALPKGYSPAAPTTERSSVPLTLTMLALVPQVS